MHAENENYVAHPLQARAAGTLSPLPYQQPFGATPSLTIQEHSFTHSVHNLTSNKYEMVKEFSSLYFPLSPAPFSCTESI